MVTITVYSPCSCAAWAPSRMYSSQIVGSLYVQATPWHSLFAASTERLRMGRSRRSRVASAGSACAICQFWQCRQAKLQPRLPSESTVVPGKKW